jgi:hypothetical protein
VPHREVRARNVNTAIANESPSSNHSIVLQKLLFKFVDALKRTKSLRCAIARSREGAQLGSASEECEYYTGYLSDRLISL